MTTNKYDIRTLQLLLDVHNRNGTHSVTLPAEFCKQVNIKPGNKVLFLAVEVRRNMVVEDLCDVLVKN